LVLQRVGVLHLTLRDEAPGSKDVIGGLATAIGALLTLALIVAVLGIAWLYLRRRRDLLIAAAAAVTAFVAFDKVLSPQYVVWLVPIVPAAGIFASGLLLVALVLTRVVFDHFITGRATALEWANGLSWWVFARDLVIVALLGFLVAQLGRVRFREGSRPRIPR
jgi:hypothetical protein